MQWPQDIFIAAIVGILSLILLVPVEGLLPGAQLDASWPYSLADATARHIPFGRDLVFTFGPLSPLYTRFFLPEQRLAFGLLKAIFVLAVCLGTLAISQRSLRWMTLLLPLLIANCLLVDPIFLVAPWIIVPLASASWSSRGLHSACLIILAAVLGPLLLVKGTLAIPLTISVGCAAFELSRRSWLTALALPCAAGASIVIAWTAVGQHPLDLLYYFRREAYVAEGYTNAMSLQGDLGEIWIYLAGSAVLLICQLFRRSVSVMPMLAAAVIMLVAFKAGFVRHDGHAMIAATALLLLALLMFLNQGGAASGTGLLAGLAAWLAIGVHYWPVDAASCWNRLTGNLEAAFVAISREARDPESFRRDFENAKVNLSRSADLPPTTGPVDLYPTSQAILLAANRDYYPRPVMQSYSAYTPELAFLNAEHLKGPHAPKTAFFGLDPIDGQYSSLADGPSWPALLGQYRFRVFSSEYAVLDRVERASAATIDKPVSNASHAFGEFVTVPQNMPFVWARMQFHPTLLGRVASMLYKMPLLSLAVITAEGNTESYRLVAGMASAGFLLSPKVTSARDFVALRSTDTDALDGLRVKSFKVTQDEGNLWGGSFDLELAALRIPADPAVGDIVLGHLEEGPPAGGLPSSGECTVDRVGDAAITLMPIVLPDRTVTVSGWGFVSSTAKGHDEGHLRIAVTPRDGRTYYASAERQARPDVDAYFHLPLAARAGFLAKVNLSSISGPAQLRVVQDGPLGPATCGPVVEIARPVSVRDGQ